MSRVTYTPEAQAHLFAIEEYIAEQASPITAERYVRAIVARCDLIAVLPRGGRLRKGVGAGLRSVSFKGRVTIYYRETDGMVAIAGIRYGGQDEARFLAALRR